MIGSRAPFGALAAALLFVFSNGCSSCGDKPKSTRWDDAAAAASSASTTPAMSAGAAASAAPVVPAGALNKFFPADGAGGYKRVFAADKAGYAEAKLQKDGKDVAVVSIADGVKPFTKAKLDESTEKIEGFPAAKFGETQSTAVVKDRFQVKVTSSTLDHEARKAVIATFDLKGLSNL